ncbi:TIGR01244 family phosphatase [Aliishimia ponticola]|uniref:TIGR01244 family phosphatase n=1 Tax=Aliishimia ponticola TaxID=2499833 RepID=A0A4S4NEV8_9RHOB|nr:TIGR01244 family sulfur transferase [Aliishimia ponticola]THH38082.1 TIGR01244 family phosphatase [Aliishimia ponticola]
MDIRNITPEFSAAPQLDPQDMPAIAAAGFQAVICNRPDAEVPPSHQAATLRAAAEAAGLSFHELPLTHQTFTPEAIAKYRAILDQTPGRVLAYCASGTRSTIGWALGQAGEMDTDDILAAARNGGYDLSNIRPALEAAAHKG